jgi:pyruvate-ferredoxin/flavodoxin oxidoreductase
MVFGKDAQQAADQALILRRVTELNLTPASLLRCAKA